jgi:hypothetical protein
LEEVKQARSCGHYLLEVIEDEEQVLIAQSGAQALQERLTCSFGHAEGLSDGREYEVWVADRGKRNEIGTVREGATRTRCHLKGESCLADTTRSGEGEETRLARLEE